MIKICRKGHFYRSGKRLLALLMSVCLIGTMIPISARAESGSTETGLYEHHTDHTMECGYAAPVGGQECTHVHDESCGYQEAGECTHIHTEECGENGENCAHEHTSECGYTEGQACEHVHDEECGYVETSVGSPCTFVCDICRKVAEQEESIASEETLTEQTTQQTEGKLITAWKWIDEEECLDEETGNLALPGASKEMPAYFDDVTAFLPTQIQATVENTEDTEAEAANETITLGNWVCKDYPKEGAYTGSYTFAATLPEGYTLSEEAKALTVTVTVELGGAVLFAVSYTAPPTGAGGVYQISTAEHLYWFAQHVNAGNTSANAVLTGDISAASMTEEWTPIGTNDNRYKGTFDGQGHTIRGLRVTGNADNVGLFGRISKAHIRNVGVAESSFQGKKYVGGICGHVSMLEGYSTIENCFSTASVSGNEYVGGLCGYVYNGRIFNSYSAGTVTGEGTTVKKFCGVCIYSTVANCYYLSESNDSGSGIDKKEIYFRNGDVAYRLSQGYQDGDSFRSGDIWGQNIGTDRLPVFNGEKVFYAPGNCHNHEEEYCSLCQGGPTRTDGVYQLCTAEHLYWFAGLVNGTISGLSQDTAANAVLCADITINQDVTDTSGLQAWTPVGTQGKPYTGTFDGQGHTISGLYVEGTAYGGLFGNTGGGAEISNVGVINSKISATEAAGGICGTNGGTIHDCYSTAAISNSGTAGGICGTNGGTIYDCYSTGSVSGSTASGGIYGQTNGEGISSCYYLAATETNLSDGTAGKTQEQFESGEVCYLLNGRLSEGNLTWGQAIGSNTAPLFGEKAVFYARSQYHNHAGGDCSLCAGYSPEQIDGVYQLYTADDLYWFAGLVNGTLSHITQNSEAKAVLKADIAVNEEVIENGSLVDTTGLREWTPIGVSGNKSFKGTFDGQGHTISGLYLETESDYVGLFGYTYIASISNVRVTDSYLSGKDNVGGVIGVAAGGTITDCHNTESVFVSGTENVGGVIGLTGLNITVTKCDNVGNVSGIGTSYNVGGVIGNAASGTVTDCHNEGRVSGHGYVGGITGTVLDGAVVKNSYNRGSISGDIDIWVGAVAGAVSGGTVQNCYYLSDRETDSIDGASCKTDAQFGSGEVAWLLNNDRTPIVWGQKLGEDAYPVLNGQQVHATYPCLSFSNEAFTSEKKEHTYDAGGTCIVCGVATKPAAIDGVYQISNEAQLYWFAGLVNGTLTDGSGSNASAKAVLTSDITVNRGVLNEDGSLAATSGLKAWTPIGVSGNNSFKGTFDGQGHTISGLYLNKASDYVGLFGCTYIASISNVRVTDSYLAGKDYVGGVIGHAFAGSVTNCHNTGRVSGENCVGGVIGQTIAYEEDEEIGRITVTNCHNTGRVSGKNCVGGVIGNAFVDTTVSNCYNTGNVSGTVNVGGVAGGAATGVTVTNCYNTGSVSGTDENDEYIGGVLGESEGTAIVTNCYYLADSETDSISGTSYKNDAQFAGGEVCYLLNGSRSAGTEQNPLVWYQNLGENGDTSPVLDNTHGIVYLCTGCPGTYSNTENEAAQHSFKPVSGGTTHKCKRCGAVEAHSTTNLAYSANEDTDKITVSCGECGEGLGYVQLNAPSGDLSYDNSEKEATVTDTITDIDFSSTPITYKQGETTLTSAPNAAGTYTASITLGDGEDAQTVSVEFIIARATPDIGTVSAQALNNTLDVSQVQLSRSVATVNGTLSLVEGTTLQYGFNNCTYIFTPNDTDNYKSVTGRVTVTVNDTIAPTAEYQIGVNGWKKFVNTISFGLFCKDHKTVEIKYSDVNASDKPGSGVKTKQYYIADKELTGLTSEEIAALPWNDYTNAISLNAKGIYFIYVRVEDNAGNSAVLNSEGIVIYAESTLSPTSMDYTYKENADREVQIAWNGNTFGKLTDGAGNTIATNNYEIDASGKLTLKKAYLDTLNVGQYTYQVYMNPQGQMTDKVTLTYSFVVNVKAQELTVTSATATDRKYDTTNAVNITAVELNGIKGTDDVSVNTTNLTGTLSGANVGIYTSVTLPTLTLTGTAAGNYTLVQPTGEVQTNVTISKADAQIIIDTGKDSYNKTFGDAAFTLNGISDTNTEANVQYAVTAGDDVISVSNGTITIKKVGEATITVSLPASANYNAAADKTIKVKVAKKSGYTVADINRSYFYVMDSADTIDLSEKLPTDCGNVTYGSPQVSKELYTSNGQPTVSCDGKLTYTVKKHETYEATGTIKVTVTTDNYADFTITVNISLKNQLPVSLQSGSSVTLQNNLLTYGQALSTLTFNSAVFVDNGGNVVTGKLAWKIPEDILNAGTTSATWVFTPDNIEYASVEGMAAIKVNKATPAVTEVPTVADRTYGPKNSLLNNDLIGGTVSVAGSWSWQTVGISPTVNNSGYVAVFTPSDSTNYETVTETITVTVSKATPYIATSPTTSAITYGDTLDASTLSGGTVQYSDSDATTVAGSFAWGDSSMKPSVSDSNNMGYRVVFTPSDADNYNTVEADITLTVNKAQNAPNMPSAVMNVANSCKKVSDVTLPTGWVWQDADKNTVLTVGTAVTATAEYNGADKGNYVNETVSVSITRSACEHAHTELGNAKAATCTADGYTGDTYCTDCGIRMKTGSVTSALGHSYTSKVTTEPTTEREGVRTYTCDRCGDGYTTAIAKLQDTNHYNPTANHPTANMPGENKPGENQPGVENTPDTGKPYIKDETGKEGWEAIKDEVDKVKDGDSIVVEMNGSFVVPGDVLDEIKGKDITIAFNMGGGITWSVNGQSITGDRIGDIDFSVKTGTNTIPVDIINNVTGERYSQQISLAYDGEFGFTAVLSINMEASNAGLYANLFYYNEKSGELEFICADEIAADGTAELTFTHASDYVIVIDKELMDGSAEADSSASENKATESETTQTSADQNDAWSPWWIIVLGIMVMVIGLGVFFVTKKKTSEDE